MCTCLTGRDKFLEEVHKWVGTYGGKILGQLRRMGSSPDWSRLVWLLQHMPHRTTWHMTHVTHGTHGTTDYIM